MTPAVPLGDLTRVSLRVGLLSFGGPAAQIALMHKEFVEDRPWLTEAQFLRALSFCMLLPGPEAMQLATYVGWRLRGIPGGLVAGGLFVLPGALVILALALAYVSYGDLPAVRALFVGVKATVVVIVLQALLRVSSKALQGPGHWAIAGAAFAGLFFLNLPFPLIIALAAVAGALTALPAPKGTAPPPQVSGWGRAAAVVGLGAGLWAAPLLWAWAAGHTFLFQVGLFFSKLAVVTFGGAYAVLAYMTQEVVTGRGWIETAQMMDGLGLAETTPGPLILVTQFVGFVAGWSAGGTGLALAAAAMTLWVTFVPCFVWIFAGAPLIDWLAGQARLAGALSAITAAVVGVIANLSVWFALHVFFAELGRVPFGYGTVLVPDLSSLDLVALGLAAVAALLLLRLRFALPSVLAIVALIALAMGLSMAQ